MILLIKITLKELAINGKNHKWDKLQCDACQRKMWGHGFVLRYFTESPDEIYLKRYRCPDCSKVVTTRPDTYWKNIRTTIGAIYQALKTKLTGSWPPGFPRQRGLHWLQRFVATAQMGNESNLSSFLERCFEKHLHFFI